MGSLTLKDCWNMPQVFKDMFTIQHKFTADYHIWKHGCKHYKKCPSCINYNSEGYGYGMVNFCSSGGIIVGLMNTCNLYEER